MVKSSAVNLVLTDLILRLVITNNASLYHAVRSLDTQAKMVNVFARRDTKASRITPSKVSSWVALSALKGIGLKRILPHAPKSLVIKLEQELMAKVPTLVTPPTVNARRVLAVW